MTVGHSISCLRGLLGVLWVSGVSLGTLGCDALNPALRYEAAARQLRFTLDRVEPRVELAFPLEQSRLRVQVDIGVDNPSDQRLRTRRVGGTLQAATQGRNLSLGTLAFPEGVEIAPRGRSTLHLEVSLRYAEVKAAWAPLSAVVFRQERATWRLEGQARFEVLGIEFGVPLRVSRESGH